MSLHLGQLLHLGLQSPQKEILRKRCQCRSLQFRGIFAICSLICGEVRQFLKMPQNCCVPNCTKKKYRTESAEKISYFKFPDDTILKKCWLHAIRRDEGKEFRVSENTKICSRHFKPEDLVKPNVECLCLFM